ncbi:XdhC family protein [Chitinivorax sp. B]|uniref:XdhC family protein n=1 Tax=Chitinivorax sp. B TaxID=2502235 RepID=UPI0010F9B324|nr:XdhC family protein [Chitinivorax sp. B]
MQSNDLEVIDQLLAWHAAGHHGALLTVLATFGSSPRPAGSLAAIRDDGLIAGSVSGGCVEEDLRHEITNWTAWPTDTRVATRQFGADAEARQRYRLPCGNSLTVAIETHWQPPLMQSLADHIRQHHCMVRQVRLTDGHTSLRPARDTDRFQQDSGQFSAVHGPTQRLLIIGAAELGRYLASIMVTLDYAVTVCDPRPEYADSWQVPHTILTTDMPDDVVQAFHCDTRTAVVAVTHDPKLDDLALIEALRTPAFYVGALGSLATNQKRRDRLHRYFDLSLPELDRLHGPVGLPIGSRTPAQIAVSIAAHLIAVKQQHATPVNAPATACRA